MGTLQCNLLHSEAIFSITPFLLIFNNDVMVDAKFPPSEISIFFLKDKRETIRCTYNIKSKAK